MKSAQSSRGRFRSTILEIIYNTKELGITPKVSSLTIANRVEMLTHHNCFLNGLLSLVRIHSQILHNI